MNPKNRRVFFHMCLLILMFISCLTSSANNKNKHLAWTPYKMLTKGMSWPKGQALPQLASIADTLDGLDMVKTSMSPSKKAMFASLQGCSNQVLFFIFQFNCK